MSTSAVLLVVYLGRTLRLLVSSHMFICSLYLFNFPSINLAVSVCGSSYESNLQTTFDVLGFILALLPPTPSYWQHGEKVIFNIIKLCTLVKAFIYSETHILSDFNVKLPVHNNKITFVALLQCDSPVQHCPWYLSVLLSSVVVVSNLLNLKGCKSH